MPVFKGLSGFHFRRKIGLKRFFWTGKIWLCRKELQAAHPRLLSLIGEGTHPTIRLGDQAFNDPAKLVKKFDFDYAG